MTEFNLERYDYIKAKWVLEEGHRESHPLCEAYWEKLKERPEIRWRAVVVVEVGLRDGEVAVEDFILLEHFPAEIPNRKRLYGAIT